MSKHKIVGNVFWLLLEHGIRLSFGLIITSILARQLGVELYGIFQYALSLVAIFSSISFICGAEVLVPALASASSERKKIIISNAFVIRFLFSLIAYLVFLIFVFLVEDSDFFYVASILGISILLNESFAVVTAWLQSQTNIKPRSVLMLFTTFLKIISIGILTSLGVTNIIAFSLVWAFESIFFAIGLVYIYLKWNKELSWGCDVPTIMQLLKEGFPFFLGLLAMFAFLRLDVIVVKGFSDLTTLGNYTAALQLFSNLSVASPVLVMSLAPILVYQQNNHILIKRNILIICAFLVCLAFVIALSTQFISSYIILLLFGADFFGSIAVLNKMSWVLVLVFLNEGLNVYLLKYVRGKLVIFKWLLALCCSGMAYMIFVPELGVNGVILGYAAGYGVACLFGFFCFWTVK